MRLSHIACAWVAALALAVPASADVTFKRKVEGKMMMGPLSGTSAQYLKGQKMREDQTIMGNDISTILDVGAGRMITLDHGRKQAEIWDMASLGQQVSQLVTGDIEARLSPTGQSRTVAGHTCAVYNMHVVTPMEMGGQKLTVAMDGPVCVSKDVPGAAEAQALFKSIAEKGFFFGDPRQAQAQPAQTKAMMALYDEMASLGVTMAQEMTFKMEAEGPMAEMMAKMGSNTMSTEVLSVSTDPIPDSIFEVPTGYTVVKH